MSSDTDSDNDSGGEEGDMDMTGMGVLPYQYEPCAPEGAAAQQEYVGDMTLTTPE